MNQSLSTWRSILTPWFMAGLLLLALPAKANPADCTTHPSARCLIQQALAQWPDTAPSDPMRITLQAHLQHEARQFGLTFPPQPEPLSPGDTEHLQEQTRQLEREEAFLAVLRQHDFTRAEQLLPQLQPALEDFSAARAESIFLEHLILTLQDETAERFKKNYYESLLALDDSTRIQRMIEVARHEMLGGQPDKGINSLKHIDIDEFSASETFSEKAAAHILAERSTALFLQPRSATRDCSGNPDNIGALLHVYLNDSVQQSVSEFSDAHLRIRTRLQLAQLHHNSGQCTLLVRWLGAQAIQEMTRIPVIDASAQLDRIKLARAIRRYTL